MRDAHAELAEFLRTRRARLLPAELGLAAGQRRRTTGLRREEVASLAGVGLSWYTRLEQGKPIQVSTGFLENLARALKLTQAERTHLFALAQHRPPPLPKTIASSESTMRLQAILDAIVSPAYVRNSRFDVIAWNAANTRIFGDFAKIPLAERNILKLLFGRFYHRRTMPDWETDARNTLAKFRINLGQAADPAPFLQLIAALEKTSPDFRRLWAEHNVSDPGEGVSRVSSPRAGTQVFQHQTLMPEGLPDIRIIVYVSVGTAEDRRSRPAPRDGS